MKIVYFREVKKMLTKRKKMFIILGMVALLVVTGCLNLFLSKKSNNMTVANYESATFLSSYRLTKKETRETMINYYNSILKTSTDPEEINETNALIRELAGRIEEEMVLEHLIMASGYEDCVVTNAEGEYTVMVKSNGLGEDEIAKILSILVSETGTSATKVKVTSV